MKKKTLLQINCTANWGSTGRIAEGIGQVAMRHGWESYVAYGRYVRPSENQLIRVGKKWHPYLNYAEQRIFDNEGLAARTPTRQLVERIEEIKPDIVHLHNIHDHYLNYRILFEYLNQRDIPVVWTFHDCWALTGHCCHFVSIGCDRWKTGCHDCPMHGMAPRNLLDASRKNWELKRRLFQGCKNLTVVGCSQWIADFVKDSFLKDNRVEVVRNGVDVNVFSPTPPAGMREGGKYKVLGVASVWCEGKGWQDIPRLRQLLPDDYEIILVGLTAKQVKELPEGVTGIQRTQNIQEMVALYSTANVFINPTYADTFPTVNLEALACGTPVVTYRTGGSPEAVDGNTGVVVEQGNVDALAHAVMEICAKGKEAYAVACRKRAVECFDKEKRYEDYIRLYEELMAPPCRPSATPLI